MTRIDVDKDEVFAVIKDSISPEYNDPNEEQQEAINLLGIVWFQSKSRSSGGSGCSKQQ